MGNVTEIDKGFKKTNYSEQKSAGVGFQHSEFYHEATAGQLVIDFNSMTLPTEAANEGFSNPSPSVLIAASLKQNRGNLTLKSYRGEWVDRIDYTIADNSKITLKKPAEEGEVFYGKIHNIVRNTLENPDLQNLVAVGTMTAGQTIFNVGKSFRVNVNPLTQVGEILVFRGFTPAPMLRNVGNAAASLAADGNYHEIDSNGGYGTTIEFNEPSSEGEVVIVLSTGRLLERPSWSMLQELETLAGQIDAIAPYVEDLMGFAPGTIQAVPNNADLKAFGDKVLKIMNSPQIVTRVTTQSNKVTPVVNPSASNILGNSTATDGSGIYSYNPLTGAYTVIKKASFNLHATVRTNAAGITSCQIFIDGIQAAQSDTPSGAGFETTVSTSDTLVPGQTFSFFVSGVASNAAETRTSVLATNYEDKTLKEIFEA